MSDEELAEAGYRAAVKEVSDYYGTEESNWPKWKNLNAGELLGFTKFVQIVREKVQSEIARIVIERSFLDGDETFPLTRAVERKRTAERFREAVEIAFRKMTINSQQDRAAWYTLRHWLEEKTNE